MCSSNPENVVASYMLKQPDGKFAVFSSIPDNFVAYGMNEAEALSFGAEAWGDDVAREKLEAAKVDAPLGRPVDGSDGLSRWRSALSDIALQHGTVGLKATLQEIGFPDDQA